MSTIAETRAVPDVTFYGASGHSCAVASQVGFASSSPRICNVLAFIDDTTGGTGLTLEGRPVLSWAEWERGYRHLACIVPIGRGDLRRRMVERVAAAGGWFPRLYDNPAFQRAGVSIGTGALVSPAGYIGPNTIVGDHVQVMPMHSVGHDVLIGPYATVAPSATISGFVEIGEAAFVGAGAVVVNGRPGRPLVIGAGAVVAAGAVVTKAVPPGVTVAGNPARPLRETARRRA